MLEPEIICVQSSDVTDFVVCCALTEHFLLIPVAVKESNPNAVEEGNSVVITTE